MIHPFTIKRSSDSIFAMVFPVGFPDYLQRDTDGYFSYNYFGYNKPGNPNFINSLKNQFGSDEYHALSFAINELKAVLDDALPEVKNKMAISMVTVCCIPRAQAEVCYSKDQLLFRQTVSDWVNNHSGMGFIDGTQYIRRIVTTQTTHMRYTEYFQEGSKPYPGITKDTCNISSQVKGKDILLIDDIYTSGVNIDEDAIQALYDNGAKSVTFYAVAYTDKSGQFPYAPQSVLPF